MYGLDPSLTDRQGPVYRRIVDALAADIAGGCLRRGQQLPTHRALAKALGVDLTTVTRAYHEARRLGLTEARVGQGTLVAKSLSQVRHGGLRPEFDLSDKLPPQPMKSDLDGRITRGVAAIEREGGIATHLNYREPGGSEADRDVAAAWMQSRIPHADRDCVVICPGTQNALYNLLITLTSPGDVLLTEALTYPGMKAAAACAGVRLVGVEMDEAGIVPDALKQHAGSMRRRPLISFRRSTIPPPRQCRSETGGGGRDSSQQRRHSGRGRCLRNARPGSPAARLAHSERTYYVASFSKCIAPRIARVISRDA